MHLKFHALMRLISTLILLVTFTLGHAEPSTESLQYQASYEGLFSAGNRIPIADIVLKTVPADLAVEGQEVFETRMSVSSASYEFVENTYPFRVSFRSLYEAAPFISLALEKYQKTRKLKHEVSWMGRDDGKVARYRRHQSENPEDYLPALLEQWLGESQGFSFYKFAPHSKENSPVDYLTMLQSLRHSELQAGKNFRFPVTDGKRFYDYRVSVEGTEQLNVKGALVDSWKLRFEGLRIKKGKTYPDHEPVTVWLKQGGSRAPLRFENSHPMGMFIIELTDERAPESEDTAEGRAG